MADGKELSISDIEIAVSKAAKEVIGTEVVKVNADIAEQNKTLDLMTEELDSVKGELEKLQTSLANSGDRLFVDKGNDLPFRNIAEQMFAVKDAAMSPGQSTTQINMLKAVTDHVVKISGLSEKVPQDGGYLLQPEFTDGILLPAMAGGEILRRVSKRTIGANSNALIFNQIDETSRVTGSRFGGLQVYHMAEGGTFTASKPKLRQVEIRVHKVGGLYYSTDELLADTTAMSGEINAGLQQEFTFVMENDIFEGNGVGKPLGFVNSGDIVSVSKETGQLANTITFNNITNMWNRLAVGSKGNSVWLANPDVEPALNNMEKPVGTGGVPVYLPPGGLSVSPLSSLMGRPIINTEHNETLGTKNDLILCDLSWYLFVTKGGMNAAQSIHVAFLTGEQTFRFDTRYGGQMRLNSPITPAKGSTTTAHIVNLNTRA